MVKRRNILDLHSENEDKKLWVDRKPARKLTPAEAQETFADEPWPHFANDGQVGLPCLRQHPAEGRQEEEMQKGSGDSAQALRREQKERGDDEKNCRRMKGGVLEELPS